MKPSTLQIGVGLSLLTHGVIFSAFSFIQSGSGNSSQSSAVPISFVIISEPVSTDVQKSNPKTILEPHAPAPASSVLNSEKSILPPESQPVTPPALPEVAAEVQTPQPTPTFIADTAEEQVSFSHLSIVEDSSTLPPGSSAPPNSGSPPQAAPPTLPPVASPGATSGPAYLYNPAPRYPAKARVRDQQGTVTVAVRVNCEGLPEEINVRETSGFDVLDRAALDAVKNWRFAPARMENRPVETRVEIPIEFRLEKAP